LAIREWSTASGALGRPSAGESKRQRDEFSANGKFLISESADKLWLQEAATGKLLLEAIGSQTKSPVPLPPAAALSPNGKASGDSRPAGRVYIYDIETAKVIQAFLPEEKEPKPAEGAKTRKSPACGRLHVGQ